MTTCPHCGGDLDIAPVAEPPNAASAVRASARYRSMAHWFGAVRGRAGIYENEQVAEAVFSALYPSQPELASAALAGWLEVGA